jgi:hypothetical protein
MITVVVEHITGVLCLPTMGFVVYALAHGYGNSTASLLE